MSNLKMRVIRYSAEELKEMDFTQQLKDEDKIKAYTAISAIMYYTRPDSQSVTHIPHSIRYSAEQLDELDFTHQLQDDDIIKVYIAISSILYYSRSEEPNLESIEIVEAGSVDDDLPSPSQFPATQTFPCSTCPKIYPSLKGRKNHSAQFCRKEQTLSPAELMVNQSIKGDRYVCQSCEYSTMKRRDLIRHSKRHKFRFTQ